MKAFDLVKQGDCERLTILGAIDGTYDLPDHLDCAEVIVDFENLTIFNSAGVRAWLVWTRNVKGITIMRLENCRYQFIKQAMYISELIPDYARVESFYVPYYDKQNDATVDFKMVRGKDFGERETISESLPGPNDQLFELDVPYCFFDFLRKKP